MWLLFWLSLGWLGSSVALHIGERRGIRTTNPVAELPGFRAWWVTFCRPYKAVWGCAYAVVSYVYEFLWRMVKG